MLLEVNNATKILTDARPQIMALNHRFAEVGMKFYFAPNTTEGLSGKDLVEAATENVLVETLATGTLGLPARVPPESVLSVAYPRKIGNLEGEDAGS